MTARGLAKVLRSLGIGVLTLTALTCLLLLLALLVNARDEPLAPEARAQ